MLVKIVLRVVNCYKQGVLMSNKTIYQEIFNVFVKLGFTSFGGPAAHVAMMEDELVTKRKWLSKERFIDMYGFTSLIPGPNSTEMAILMGYHRGGIPGLIIAGLSFILPAVFIVLALAFAYVTYGSIPMYIGAYEILLDGIGNIDLMIIIPVGIGFGLSILLFAKIINVLFKKAYGFTYYTVLGFIIGSIFAIVPPLQFGMDVLFGILITTMGAIASYKLSRLGLAKQDAENSY